MYALNGRDLEGMLVLVVDQEGLRAKRRCRCRQQRASRLYVQHARHSTDVDAAFLGHVYCFTAALLLGVQHAAFKSCVPVIFLKVSPAI